MSTDSIVPTVTPPDSSAITTDGINAAPSAVAPADPQLLKFATDAYRSSTNYFNANIRIEIEKDLRQWQSNHPRDSKYHSPTYRGRSRLFRPKTRAFVQKSEAQAAEALFSSIDVVNLTPDDEDDPRAVKASHFYKALLQKRLTMPEPIGLPWYVTCMGAYQEAMVTGVCISKQYWEFDSARGRNRPRADLIPIENFRFDPACDWRNPILDSPYLVHIIPMYVGDIKARMATGKWRMLPESVLQTATKQYSDSIRLQRENNRVDQTNQKHDFSDFDIAWVHENIVWANGVDWHFYTIGTEQVLSIQAEPVENVYAHGRPFQVGFATIEAHRNYPSAPVRLVRDVQREANDLANLRIDNVQFVLNKRYFGKRTAQIDTASLSRNVPGSTTLMNDPENDVKVISTPDVTSSSYQEQDRLNLDFDDVTGQFNGSTVASNRKLNETVGGMNLLASTQAQVPTYRLRNWIQTWVEPVLQQLVEIEKNYEDDVRVVTMAAQMADLGPDELADDLWEYNFSLNVNVGMGATNPQERTNQLLLAFSAIKNIVADGSLEERGLDTEEVVSEIFSMIGYRDGSRFFHAEGDEDPNVTRLKNQIAQLQQALAAKYPPELLAANVDKVRAATVQTMMQAFYAAMQSGQVVASVPSVAPVADSMLQSAGFQPNPEGQDPNIPAPAAPDPALTQGDVMNGRTGVSFMPGGAQRENTNPTYPALPASADAGARHGIETQRADGVR